MKFSVILPCHDPAPDQLEYALDGVLAQLDPREHDILIVDDQSQRYLRTIAGYARYGSRGVRYLRTEREVFGHEAANIGIAATTGDLVHVLHPDDAVLPGFYAAVAGAAQRSTSALIATAHIECDEMLRPFACAIADFNGGFPPLHAGNPLAVAGCAVRRSFLQTHGGWEVSLSHTADWLLWAKAAHLGGMAYLACPLVCYRHGVANNTARQSRAADNLRDYLRLASMVESFAPNLVDWPRFRDYIAARAQRQADEFFRRDDLAAARANDAFIAELEGAR